MSSDGDPRDAGASIGVKKRSGLRFDASDLDSAASWLTLRQAPGITIRSERFDHFRESYYDTEDSRVFRSGYALCVRSSPEAHLASLKSLKSVSNGAIPRAEINEPIPSEDVDEIFDSMGRVGEKARTICGNRSLAPLGSLTVTRRTFIIEGMGIEGKAFEAEIRLEVILASGDSMDRANDLRRLEVELPEAAVPSLAGLVDEMRLACALRPSLESRTDEILGLLPLAGKGTPDLGSIGIGPSLTIGEVAVATMRRQFASFLKHEPGARLGENDEEIHDMRVATRRMRAALRLFRDYLPRRTTARMMRELRWIALALGEVRDLDVQIAQIRAWDGRLLLVDQDTIHPLLDLLAKRRTDGRRKLLDVLDSTRYDRDVATMIRLLRRGFRGDARGADLPIRAVTPLLIRDHHRKLLKATRRVRDGSSPDDYHRVRIRCKRYRYALEFLENVVGPPAKGMIASSVKVQDILGQLQDSRVAIALLKKIAASRHPHLPERTLTALGEIAQLYDRSGEEARGSYPGAIRRLRGKRWRSVDRALGRLSEKASDDLVRRLAPHDPHPKTE
jgi:CHAD domain-containing protein